MRDKILIIEDEPKLLVQMVDLLTHEGYEVISATNGIEGIRLYEAEQPNLILLDIGLPDTNGYEICKTIRQKDPMVSILMVTAKERELDKVVGLEIGADDYIVKPFGVDEFVSRVKAALRRLQAKPKRKNDNPIEFADVSINPKTLKGKKGNKEFVVTLREVQLLQLFLHHEGEVIDRNVILEEIWGVKYPGTTRTLDQGIVKLRQKIEDNPSEPKFITMVYGQGYRFNS